MASVDAECNLVSSRHRSLTSSVDIPQGLDDALVEPEYLVPNEWELSRLAESYLDRSYVGFR